MINKIKTRMASEEGFTLIELLVVMIILGILVAIAVPAYLSFTSKAKTVAAEANVRSAIPAAESWYQDTTNNTNSGTYKGLSFANLNKEAPGIAPTVQAAPTETAGAGYCIQDTENSTSFYYIGGAPTATLATGTQVGKITSGVCSDAVTGIVVG